MPAEKDRSIVKRKSKALEIFQPSNNHLLIIGIDNYSNKVPALNNAVKDAMALKDVLQKEYLFPKEKTIELINKEATRKNILKTFDHLLLNLTDQDNLIVFFSGHGEYIESLKRGYWLPIDAVFEERDTYLSNNEVTDFFRNLKARHVFGIIDSCFSGALFRGKEEMSKRLATLPSRWLLTAGRVEPVSDGSLGENSPFMESLLTQLKYDSEGILWSSELCDRVLIGVDANAQNQTPRGEPLQNVGHHGGQFVFFRKDVQATKIEEELNQDEAHLEKQEAEKTTERNVPKVEEEPIPIKKEINPQMPIQEIIDLLKKSIIEGDFRKVFDDIEKVIASDASANSTLILLQSRYNSNRRNELNGTISQENLQLEYARITNALISTVLELRQEDLKT